MAAGRWLAAVIGTVAALSTAWPASGPPPAGAIEGEVTFTGKPPAPRKLTTNDGVILHRDLVIDPKTKGLRDVVVSLEGAPRQPKAARLKAAYMDQRESMFVPRVLAVQHGQKVRFDNNDGGNHSVMASSGTKANAFNLFVTPATPVERAFEAQKAPVQIGCSIHAWMRAWVYVFDHPWFAVTDAKGRFRIVGVAPGKHTLLFRHADGGLIERRTVEVKAGKTARLRVEWKKAGE